MDVWSWICELPESDGWSENGENILILELATHLRHSLQLKAERTLVEPSDDSSEAFISLSFSLQYSHSSVNDDPTGSSTTLWVSEKCNLSKDQPFLPLVLQILQEIISRAPNYPGSDCSSCSRSQLQSLKPEPVSWILDSHSQESFSSFFNLIFLTRLFWLCVFEAPSEVGSLYFRSLLTPNLETFSCKHAPVLKTFFVSVGTDVELCFMRTFSYMLAKSLLFRDIGMGAVTPANPRSISNLGVTYATESHGMWILKGYIPVNAMDCVLSNRRPNVENNPFYTLIEPKESVLKYALAHQQLEAVIQLEYTAVFCEGFIQVQAKLDNIRLHVVKLGFKNKEGGGRHENEEDFLLKEKHFPSRVRVWVGPEVGANYVGSLSLGRSTDNVEREVEMQKILQGSLGKVKVPTVKGKARMASKTKLKNWRWDQDVDGNAAIFDGILCDNTTGVEIATWKPPSGGGGDNKNLLMANNFGKRYSGGSRAFTKSGGMVFAGTDEFDGGENGGGGVGWRLSKDMEGSVLKWRIGAQVWLSYWPNEVKTSYYETRRVNWCDEVDLPLIPSKHS